MGSLTSRPKAPAAISQPVIYTVPPASYTPPASTAPAVTTETAAPDGAGAADPDKQQEAARSAGLLDRRRGVLSTVVTGFRGVLTPSAAAPRKTLLGE